MDQEEKLALFLGMLSGDGCLSIKHNGQGYRDYPIQFYNTEKDKVILFDDLLFDTFGIRGRISSRKRENRKEIWEFLKHSKEVVQKLKKLGFPEGIKRDILRVPNLIFKGTNNQKRAFIYGVTITDGSIKKDNSLLFHSGSKLFLEDLSILMVDFINKTKPVKEFLQREKYKSYQLYLNKKEKDLILGPCATMVLGRS